MKGGRRGREARVAEYRVTALRLRQEGRSFREIARDLHVDVKTAFRYVSHGIEELEGLEIAEAKKLRTLELSRVDRLYAAVSGKAKRGNIAAIAAAIRLSEHRCDLLGLTGKRAAAEGGPAVPTPPPVPTVQVTVINQQTVIQIREVVDVAREHGLLDRLLSLPELSRVTVEQPVERLEAAPGQGEHAGNGNGLHAGNGSNGTHPS